MGLEINQMNYEEIHVRFFSRPIEVYKPLPQQNKILSLYSQFSSFFSFFVYFLDNMSYFSKSNSLQLRDVIIG